MQVNLSSNLRTCEMLSVAFMKTESESWNEKVTHSKETPGLPKVMPDINDAEPLVPITMGNSRTAITTTISFVTVTGQQSSI